MWRILSLLLLIPTTLSASYMWDLSVCAIFQNEAQWLQEWIEYHRLIGVEHFLLYDHYSTDNWREVLEPYIECGLVEVVDWSDQPRQIWRAQNPAYDHALEYLRGISHWVAFIDIDEFMVVEHTDSMVEFLQDYEEYGGVALTWRGFGTSGVDHLEPGELLIEKLDQCAKRVGGWFKSIVQPELTVAAVTCHHFAFRNELYSVDPLYNRTNGPTHWTIYQKAWINHYRLRTMDWAYGEKARRTKIYRGWDDERIRESIRSEDERWSTHVDQTIQRFVPALKEALLCAPY